MPIAYRIRGFVRDHGPLTADSDFAALSRKWKVPESEIRSAVEFFSELNGPATRLCTGLPCRLAGSEDLRTSLEKQGTPFREIPCAGHCDRAPVLVGEDGNIQAGNPPGTAAVDLTEIRCLAADPILSRRLLDREAGEASPPETGPGVLLKRLRKSGSPLANRWTRAAETKADQRFIVGHSRPGTPGAFACRILMERDPRAVVESMILAGLAIGAAEGVLLVPAENAAAFAALEAAADAATAAGQIGEGFEHTVVAGFGSDVAGEETALLNAIEGRRGEVRTRPPEPEIAGLFGFPTVAEPVDTLLAAAGILRGNTAADPGARLVALTAGFSRPGLVEIDRTITLREVIEDAGESESSLAAVLFGGPHGSVITPRDWDLPLDEAALSARGFVAGHWGLMPIPVDADFRAIAEGLLDFAAAENCGKCQPCRLGSTKARHLLDAGESGGRRFREILNLMEAASLCDFGRKIPGPVRQLLEHFGDRMD